MEKKVIYLSISIIVIIAIILVVKSFGEKSSEEVDTISQTQNLTNAECTSNQGCSNDYIEKLGIGENEGEENQKFILLKQMNFTN